MPPLLLLLDGVDVDDSLRRFSSKSCKVIGRLRMLAVELQKPPAFRLAADEPASKQPFKINGFDGVVIMVDEDKITGEAVKLLD